MGIRPIGISKNQAARDDSSDATSDVSHGHLSGDASNRPVHRAIDWNNVTLHASLVVGLLVVAIIMWWNVWVNGNPTRTLTSQFGDPSQWVWFLRWTPWAISHGHNPFLSNAIYAGQGGANTLAQTSGMALALLFAPITWLSGPITALNVALVLGPVVSGWCFFLAVRKVTTFVPGQLVGAALYGLSPAVVMDSPVAHLNWVWLFFPPLAFLLLYDLCVSRLHRPALIGLGLGLLTVVQFFTSTELLAVSALISVFGLLVAALLAPHVAWARRKSVLVGLATASATAFLLLAYPAWFVVAGPRHITGAVWPGTAATGSAISWTVDAGVLLHQNSYLIALGGYFGPTGANYAYIGIALLAFLAVSAIVWFRRRLAWVVLAVGALAWAFSLGAANPSTGGNWLPWRLFQHAPLVSEISPFRFHTITLFAVALLLSLSADGWWRLVAKYDQRNRAHREVRHLRYLAPTAGVCIAVVTAATLIPIAEKYTFPFKITKSPTPAWFVRVAPHLPLGTEVLAYPFPNISAQVMRWQAVDNMQFRIVGGYGPVIGADGRHSAVVSPIGGAYALLTVLSFPSGPLPLATLDSVRTIRESMRRWGVQVVVVTNEGRDPAYATGYLTAVLGRLPRRQANAWVWYGLGKTPPLSVSQAGLVHCTSDFAYDSLLLPKCVIQEGERVAGTPGLTK